MASDSDGRYFLSRYASGIIEDIFYYSVMDGGWVEALALFSGSARDLGVSEAGVGDWDWVYLVNGVMVGEEAWRNAAATELGIVGSQDFPRVQGDTIHALLAYLETRIAALEAAVSQSQPASPVDSRTDTTPAVPALPDWRQLYFEKMQSALAFSAAADSSDHSFFEGDYPSNFSGFMLVDLFFVVRLLHVFNGRDVSDEEYDRLMSDLMAGYEEVSFTPSYLGHWVQDPVDGSWDWSWSARGTVFTDRDLQAFLDSYVSVR